MLYRPLARHKRWWDGTKSKGLFVDGVAALLMWAFHFQQYDQVAAANDRDHIKW